MAMVAMDMEDMEAMARGRLMLPMDMVDMGDMVVIVTLGMVMATAVVTVTRTSPGPHPITRFTRPITSHPHWTSSITIYCFYFQ